MAKMTLTNLLGNTSDKDLLDMFEELETGVLPSTGYMHEFCRKVNRMIDSGKLCVDDRQAYRHVYLPTISKALYEEMAQRYADYMRNYKVPADATVVIDTGVIIDTDTCELCGREFLTSQLYASANGRVCAVCMRRAAKQARTEF